MNSYSRNVIVGAFVLVALLAFGGGTLWLRGKSLGKADVAILYADIGNLKEGAPVRISGAPAGRVVDIIYQGVGKVAVGLKFDRPIPITSNATAAITGVGMLGDMVITLDPGNGAPRLRTDTIRGTMAAGVFDKAAGLADTAALTLRKVNAMLDTQLVVELRHTLVSTQHLMAQLADPKNGPTAQLGPTLVALQKTSARLDTTMAQLDVKTLQARIDTTMRSAAGAADRLAALTAHADSLIARIQHGDGTIGKFLNDSSFYTDLRKTMQAMTDLLNEIKKNPGKIGVTVKIF
jgi:phospholipid/cholesterol/gamma-HCH transport system substrate-binding protein